MNYQDYPINNLLVKALPISATHPCCGKGEMHVIMSFGANAPPFHDMINELKNNKLEQPVS